MVEVGFSGSLFDILSSISLHQNEPMTLIETVAYVLLLHSVNDQHPELFLASFNRT